MTECNGTHNLVCSHSHTASAGHVVRAAPIAGNNLGMAPMIINDAVVSWGSTMVLGLKSVGLGVSDGLLLVMVEEVMLATPLQIVIILARVGSLILEHLKDLVTAVGQERTHEGTKVVDPIIPMETSDN